MKKYNNKLIVNIKKHEVSSLYMEGNKTKDLLSSKIPNSFMDANKITNVDLFAHEISKIIPEKINKTKTVVEIILPDSFVSQLSCEINDIEISVDDYIFLNFDKISNGLSISDYYYDYNIIEKENYKKLTIYFSKKEEIDKIEGVFESIGLKVQHIESNEEALKKILLENEKNKLNLIISFEKNSSKFFFTNGIEQLYIEELTGEIDRNLKNIEDVINAFNSKEKDKNKEDEDDFLDLKSNEKEQEEREYQKYADMDALALENDVADFIKTNYTYVENILENLGYKTDEMKATILIDKIDEIKILEVFKKLKLYNINVFVKSEYENSNFSKIKEKTINLHDWRTEKKSLQNKRFQTKLFLFSLLAISIIGVLHLNISDKIKTQRSINSFYQKAINEDQILKEEIETLSKNKSIIEKRIKTINSLEVERPNIINVFSSLVDSIPKEIYLNTLIRDDNKNIKIQGVSYDNEKIFEFVKILEKSEWLYDIKITSINLDKESSSEQKYVFDISMKEIVLQ